MDLRALVAAAQGGDLAAFTALVRRYQDLAFGSAFALLRDAPLAEDAAQEAFVAAYAGLGALADPEKFPAWLRGIVRHQCARHLRRRRVATVPLDRAAALAAPGPGPDQRAEARDTRERILAAIAALPEAQREVTILYYLREYSQREVAAFLGLPVTTVNNRLHAARRRLQGALIAMTRDALRGQGLPDDFAARVGTIIRARGPVVEARFPPGDPPPVLNALTIAGPGGAAVSVAQRLGDGVVRGIVAGPGAGRVPSGRGTGREIVDTDRPTTRAVGPETVRQAVALLGRPASGGATELVETGIKIIDLLCPYPRGGAVGVFGDPGVGKMVLIEELAHNVTGAPDAPPAFTLFAFVGATGEVGLVRDTAGPALPSSPSVQAVYIPVADPLALAASDVVVALDATTCLTRAQLAEHWFPAVDPLLSSSRGLTPALAGREHCDVAEGVRELLRRARELRERSGPLDAAERSVVERARRVRNFLAQPMFVAASYTGQPGRFVARVDTVRGCAALLAGAGDHLPAEAFLNCGTLDEALARG